MKPEARAVRWHECVVTRGIPDVEQIELPVAAGRLYRGSTTIRARRRIRRNTLADDWSMSRLYRRSTNVRTRPKWRINETRDTCTREYEAANRYRIFKCSSRIDFVVAVLFFSGDLLCWMCHRKVTKIRLEHVKLYKYKHNDWNVVSIFDDLKKKILNREIVFSNSGSKNESNILITVKIRGKYKISSSRKGRQCHTSTVFSSRGSTRRKISSTRAHRFIIANKRRTVCKICTREPRVNWQFV